jgi:hypothetical protein
MSIARRTVFSILIVFAVSSLAQTDSTTQAASTAAAPAPAPAAETVPQPQAVDVNQAAMAAIASVQAQQQISGKYATLMLDYHAAMGWLQVSNHWMTVAKNQQSNNLEDLEEDDEDEDFVPLGTFANHVDSQDPRGAERAGEQALLGVLKVVYLQASKKLHEAHQSHYQTKVQLMLLQAAGAGNSGLSSVITLMYYLETLRSISSALTIQRQDSWNQWALLESLETSLIGPISQTFSQTLSKARLNAMGLYYQEASTELQIFYLEYYLQMIVTQLSAPHAASSAASFLEEEMTAEPNKPFSPFMMMGLGGGQYMGYYSLMLRFWAVTMNSNAAQGLYLAASHQDKPNPSIQTYAVSALQQWAYLKLQQSMIDMYSLFGAMQGAPAFHHNAAAAASFVQTQAPLTSPENVPSIENSKSL